MIFDKVPENDPEHDHRPPEIQGTYSQQHKVLSVKISTNFTLHSLRLGGRSALNARYRLPATLQLPPLCTTQKFTCYIPVKLLCMEKTIDPTRSQPRIISFGTSAVQLNVGKRRTVNPLDMLLKKNLTRLEMILLFLETFYTNQRFLINNFFAY